ncbi:MAG TPA: hypothetical protein VIK14_17220 [Ignavibacteria bacterium]
MEKTKIKNEIFILLSKWKTAWVSRNIKKYKSFYTTDLIGTDKNGNEISYSDRMKTAEKNFKNLKYINVDIRGVVFEFDDDYPNEVTVKFRQSYNSNTYYDYGLKTLMIYKGKSTGYKWKIYREKFETIKQTQIQTKNIKENTDGEISTFDKFCYGILILIVLTILVSIIKKILD